MSILSRRNFLTGLIAAPVIIRASSLMPVKVFDRPIIWGVDWGVDLWQGWGPSFSFQWWEEIQAIDPLRFKVGAVR